MKTFHEALEDLIKSYKDQGTAWAEIWNALINHKAQVSCSMIVDSAAIVSAPSTDVDGLAPAPVQE